MAKTADLTLTSVDSMRHLLVSEDIVHAISFAARHSTTNLRRDVEVDRTAYRFVVAAVMVDALQDRGQWIGILDHILHLEHVERMEQRKNFHGPLFTLDTKIWIKGEDTSGRVHGVLHGSAEYEVRWTDGRRTFVNAWDVESDDERKARKD